MSKRKIHVGIRTPVMRIRYKDTSGIRARLFMREHLSEVPPTVPGRILRVNKVSVHEQWKMGEFNMFPKTLMREFRRKEQKKGIAGKFEQIEKELKQAEEMEQPKFKIMPEAEHI